jgi:hypothetical protein
MATNNMLDFVDNLTTNFDIKDDFNFSILVEQKPTQKKYSHGCKVLSIILQTNSKRIVIHYDQIQEFELTYIEIKDNRTRKVGVRNTPFFIDGNSKLQTFKGNEFIEYSFRNPTRTDLKFVEKVREKFNIPAPHEFTGAKLTFEENDFFD